jgi:hypothetical protein
MIFGSRHISSFSGEHAWGGGWTTILWFLIMTAGLVFRCAYEFHRRRQSSSSTRSLGPKSDTIELEPVLALHKKGSSGEFRNCTIQY